MTAPKVFISYTHDSPEHKDAILTLSDRLRREGIDCTIDQYEQSPEEGWPRWCEKQVEQANFVLVACTETYLRRFRGGEVPGQGLGGTWEGHIITQELYNAQGKNTKFIPVTFRPEDAAFIPLLLQSATAYQLYDAYDLLYRRLTGHRPAHRHLSAVSGPCPRANPCRPSPAWTASRTSRPSGSYDIAGTPSLRAASRCLPTYARPWTRRGPPP